MIDIHAHVLPSIDDGAENLKIAAAMCRFAADDGCTALLATPHQRTPSWWNCDPRKLQRDLDEVRAEVGDTPRLYLGGEIRVDASLLEALGDIEGSGVQPLAGSRYLLLELSRRGLGRLDPEALAHELRLLGWRPIFAHPEFIPDLSASPRLIEKMARSGALFQLTAMSLTGGYGRKIQRFSEKLVADGLVHFVASDAHDLTRRPPGLRKVHDALSRKFGRDRADQLTMKNPGAILANRPIEASAN